MTDTGKDIKKAKQLLERGELVAIPTETVYGLAGNALSTDAVVRIFEVKNRPHFDPLIVHIASVEDAERYAAHFPPTARKLAENFWPGPLTLLVDKKNVIPDLVTSGSGQVALRCPDHVLTRQLLNDLDFPLAAPSANPFGYVSPTTAQHVVDQLGEKIPYVLDGGPCTVGIESTIIGFEDGKPVVHRLGGLSLEALEAIAGKMTVRAHSTSNPKAPGQLKSHYAPKRKVMLGKLEELIKKYPEHSAVLSFRDDHRVPHQFILSPSGSVNEAARNLFTALRHLDRMPVDRILAELVPEQGLGRAINDRLRRAAAEEENASS